MVNKCDQNEQSQRHSCTATIGIGNYEVYGVYALFEGYVGLIVKNGAFLST